MSYRASNARCHAADIRRRRASASSVLDCFRYCAGVRDRARRRVTAPVRAGVPTRYGRAKGARLSTSPENTSTLAEPARGAGGPQDATELAENRAVDAAVGPGVGPDPTLNLADVGSEITTVLRTAHAAAKEMRAKAERNAEQIRTQAESAAASIVADAQREATALRRELQQLRDDADAHGRVVRDEAEAYAAQVRSAADEDVNKQTAEADRLLRGARAEAKKIIKDATSEGERRKAVLEADAARFEERFANVLTTLRGISGQLEDVVLTGVTPPRTENPEGVKTEDLEEQSLDQALKSKANAKRTRSARSRSG